MVDVSSGRKVKKQFLPALNGSEKNFFNTTLEDVYREKYGGRMPLLTENVASTISTGLKAAGVPKYRAEDVGRRITHLAEDWTPFGALPAVEKGGLLGTGLGVLAAVPIVGGKAGKVAKAVEEILPEPGGLLAGIRGYHGSPHSFAPEPGAPLGRFRDTAIGTGEGAQAYGRGHYLAEQEKTAQAYRKNLSGPDPNYEGGIAPELKQALRDEDNLGFDTMGEALTAIRNHPDWAQRWDVSNPQRLQQLFEAHDAVKYGGRGHMYEVNIAADPEHFLDWDKPIAEQPRIAAAIDERIGDPDIVFQRMGIDPATASGSELVRGLGGAGGGKDPAVSAKLQEWGFPGIRYLDQGSRVTSGGELLGVEKTPQGWQAKVKVTNRQGVGIAGGPTDMFTTSKPYATEAEARKWAEDKISGGSRNYVVFDPALIKIVRKYGLAAAIGAGIVSEEMGRQMQQQGEI